MICPAQESDFIQDFSHKLNIELGIDTRVFTYNIENSATNSTFKLKPNESVRLAASMHYKFIGLTIGFSPKFLNNNEDEVLKGESKITSVQLRLFIKRFIQEFEYNYIEGFYVDNTTDHVPNWIKGQDPYLQLDGLSLKRFGGKTAFVWNENFSFKALLVKNQKQAKSAGSFVPSFSYVYSELNNPNDKILVIDESNFDFNVNAGYIHNFVFGKDNNFFTSLGLSPGLGVKYTKMNEEDEFGNVKEKKARYSNFSFEGRLNLGYNSNKMFTGLQFNVLSVAYNKTPETKVEDSNTYFQLYFGYRFDAPKTLSRLFNKI